MTVGDTASQQLGKAWRRTGFWMSVPLALFQGLSAVSAFRNPDAFAAKFGAPLADAGDAAWVHVYGLRTAFIALLGTGLLLRRDLNGLKWALVVAPVMPLGDAYVASQAGAPLQVCVQHMVVALYVMLAAATLWFGTRGQQPRIASSSLS